MIKAALFPKVGLPPPPHTMLLQGGHFERTDPTLYGGQRNGEIVKKKPSVPLLLTRIVAVVGSGDFMSLTTSSVMQNLCLFVKNAIDSTAL